MTRILGPIPCLTCRKPVVWDRFNGKLTLMERVGKEYRRHVCLAAVKVA